MRRAKSSDPPTCIYCGNANSSFTREHIIPKSIGGSKTLNHYSTRRVCANCNNGILAELDNELCRRSHLAVIASQEIDSELWQVWDVDLNDRNLLIEARPNWAGNQLRNLFYYPQIIFDKAPQIRSDAEEMQSFGYEDYIKVLVKAAVIANIRNREGERVIHLERVRRVCPMSFDWLLASSQGKALPG